MVVLLSPETFFPCMVAGADDARYDVLLGCFPNAFEILAAGIVSAGLFSPETSFAMTRTVAGKEDDRYDVPIGFFANAFEILAVGIVSFGLLSSVASFPATRVVAGEEDDRNDVL